MSDPKMRPFGPTERKIFDILAEEISFDFFMTTDSIDLLTLKIADAIKTPPKPKFKHFLKGKSTKRVPSRTRLHKAAKAVL